MSIAERERFIQPILKKGSSIEYVSENRIFTDADDYSMEIELPLADCPQSIAIFGMINRKVIDAFTVEVTTDVTALNVMSLSGY